MTEHNEFTFDDETIRILEESTRVMNLLNKAIPMFDKLTDAEKDLLDRLIPSKGTLSNENQKEKSV